MVKTHLPFAPNQTTLRKTYAGNEDMDLTRDDVLAVLSRISTPGGGDLVSRDLVRALVIEGGQIGRAHV